MPRTDPMDLLYSFENQGQQALSGLQNLKSGYEGINTAGDVKSRFGFTNPKDIFAPLFQNLATAKAKGLRGASLRAGRSASPEMSFSPVEENYYGGLNTLNAEQGRAEQDQNTQIANLLHSILSEGNSFNLNKLSAQGGLASSLFGNRLNLSQFDRQGEGPKFWDIFASILGAGAPVAGAALGKPSTTYNFGNEGTSINDASRRGPT